MFRTLTDFEIYFDFNFENFTKLRGAGHGFYCNTDLSIVDSRYRKEQKLRPFYRIRMDDFLQNVKSIAEAESFSFLLSMEINFFLENLKEWNEILKL